MRANGVLHFLVQDHLGSTATVLDSTGAVVSAQKYYPYGRVRTATGLSPTDKTFTGHQQEGSLVFMQARFYDPALGRFMSADTIVPHAMNGQAMNRYSYVEANPLKYVDPTGRCPVNLGWFNDECDAVQDFFTDPWNDASDGLAAAWARGWTYISGYLDDAAAAAEWAGSHSIYATSGAAEAVITTASAIRETYENVASAGEAAKDAVAEYTPKFFAAAGETFKVAPVIQLSTFALAAQATAAAVTDYLAVKGCAAGALVAGAVGCVGVGALGYPAGYTMTYELRSAGSLAGLGALAIRQFISGDESDLSVNIAVQATGPFQEVNLGLFLRGRATVSDYRWSGQRIKDAWD